MLELEKKEIRFVSYQCAINQAVNDWKFILSTSCRKLYCLTLPPPLKLFGFSLPILEDFFVCLELVKVIQHM